MPARTADLTQDHSYEARSRLAAPSTQTDHTSRGLALAEAHICATLAVADAIHTVAAAINAVAAALAPSRR